MLKGVDLPEPFGGYFLREAVLQPGQGGLRIPAPIQDGDPALFRNAAPVAVQPGTAFVLVSGRKGGMDLEAAGIQVLEHVGNQRALSGCAPALKEDDHRKLCVLNLMLKDRELGFQLLGHILIFFLGHGIFQREFVQHGNCLLAFGFVRAPPAPGADQKPRADRLMTTPAMELITATTSAIMFSTLTPVAG